MTVCVESIIIILAAVALGLFLFCCLCDNVGDEDDDNVQ